LYLVSTPIGNLADITLRAVEVLGAVDVVLAEDTRTSRHLLDRYGIGTRLEALHERNEEVRVPELLARLREQGAAFAVISDAGTPLLSDPGFRLVRAAHECGITVHAIPGASALLAALASAGIPWDRFAFEGFLPAKRGARQQRLGALRHDPRTLVFFEAPHRLRESLADMVAAFGPERLLCVARELTKLHETLYRGHSAEVAARVAADENAIRGECVVVVQGSDTDAADLAGARVLLGRLLERFSQREAIDIATEVCHVPRNTLYSLALEWRARR
jgi:16S rRNA (cytidine1402-2'-O)-methyltransferase